MKSPEEKLSPFEERCAKTLRAGMELTHNARGAKRIIEWIGKEEVGTRSLEREGRASTTTIFNVVHNYTWPGRPVGRKANGNGKASGPDQTLASRLEALEKQAHRDAVHVGELKARIEYLEAELGVAR